MREIIRELVTIATLAEALGIEDISEIDGLCTDEESERIIAIVESVPDTDENEALTQAVVNEMLRESVQRLLALEVTPSDAETEA